jgi:hypothetical protein
MTKIPDFVSFSPKLAEEALQSIGGSQQRIKRFIKVVKAKGQSNVLEKSADSMGFNRLPDLHECY